jgi:hypothetical protein
MNSLFRNIYMFGKIANEKERERERERKLMLN